MPPTISKSSIVSLGLLVVGLILHARGFSMNDQTKGDLTNLLGLIFDAVSGIIIYVRQMHNAALAATKTTPQGQDLGKGYYTGYAARPYSSYLLLVGIVGIALSASGCAILNPGASTDQDKLAAAEGTFNASLQVLVTARSAHLIKDETYKQIDFYVQAANAALDQVHADLSAGKKLDQSEAWSAVNAAVQQLLIYKVRYSNGPGNSTRPSVRGTAAPADSRSAYSEWRENYSGGGRADRRAA